MPNNELDDSVAATLISLSKRLSECYPPGQLTATGFSNYNYSSMVLALWEASAGQLRQKNKFREEHEFWDKKIKQFQFEPPQPEAIVSIINDLVKCRQVESLILNSLYSPTRLDEIELEISALHGYSKHVDKRDDKHDLLVYPILLAHFSAIRTKTLATAWKDYHRFKHIEMDNHRRHFYIGTEDPSTLVKIALAFFALDIALELKTTEWISEVSAWKWCLQPGTWEIIEFLLSGKTFDCSVTNPTEWLDSLEWQGNVLNNIWLCRWKDVLVKEFYNPNRDSWQPAPSDEAAVVDSLSPEDSEWTC